MVEIVTALALVGGILTIAYGCIKLDAESQATIPMGRTAAKNITEEEAIAIGEALYEAVKDGKLTQTEAINIISKVLSAVSTK